MAVIINAGIGIEALAERVHTYPVQAGAILLAAQAYTHECDKAAPAICGAGTALRKKHSSPYDWRRS